MRKRTGIGKFFCMFRPKKQDILSEAESIVNEYIYGKEEYTDKKGKSAIGKINIAMNITIIGLAILLAYLVYMLL